MEYEEDFNMYVIVSSLSLDSCVCGKSFSGPMNIFCSGPYYYILQLSGKQYKFMLKAVTKGSKDKQRKAVCDADEPKFPQQ